MSNYARTLKRRKMKRELRDEGIRVNGKNSLYTVVRNLFRAYIQNKFKKNETSS